MSARQTVDVVLDYIERNLRAPLSLADIAEAVGLSPYHLSRLFTAVMAESVMAYVRTRRLELAAARLLEEPKIRLIDLALDCGFESQEAFTRAFKRALGLTPGELRRRGRAESLQTREEGMLPMLLQLQRTLVLEPRRVHRAAFSVAGMSGRFDRESRSTIPLLWDRLTPFLPLASQIGWRTYGVCWSTDLEEGSFNYMAAVEVEAGVALPDGIEALAIPDQTYAVFRQSLDAGNLHLQMSSACDEIWGSRLSAQSLKPQPGPDFEFYPEDFTPGRPGFVEYYIPVTE